MDGMTIKQIAEIANVSEQTIRDWITSAPKTGPGADPNILPAVTKIRAAGHGKAAMLSLAETLSIIRAGGRDTLADLLGHNAEEQKPIPAISQAEDMRQFMKTMVVEMMPAMAAAIATAIKPAAVYGAVRPPSNRQLALPESSPSDDYYTIKGYGNTRGVRITKSTAISLGRDASRLSRMKNVEIRKSKDLEWGQVNAYHASILQDIFTI